MVGMTRFLALAALCCACSGDPQISAEPATQSVPSQTATLDAGAPPAEIVTETPTAPAAPPAEVPPHAPDAGAPLEAPPDPVPDPYPVPEGMHESGGACYLPNVLPRGSCRCDGDNVCVKRCEWNEKGVAVAYAFCFDGGLPADYMPR
jgi:hypothetical protein